MTPLAAGRLAALLAAFCLAASAAAQAPTKMGAVNMDRILREAPLAQSAQKRIESEFTRRDQELKELATRVQRLQEGLQKDGVTLSENDRRTRERELGELSRDFQRKQNEFREDFERRRQEELNAIVQKALGAVKQIAESEKFDIVVSQAVYVSKSVDLTDRVMKAMQ